MILQALDSLLTALLAQGRADAATIWLRDPASPGRFTLEASRGAVVGSLPPALLSADGTFVPRVLTDGVGRISAAEAVTEVVDLDGFGAVVGIRLGSAEQPAGFCCLYHTDPSHFGSDQVAAARALADLAAVALKAAHRAAVLEQGEAAQAQFIHITTHELRSPIAVSQTLVRNVVKGYAGPLTDKQQYIFSRVSAQLDMLEGLVNDLLELAASKAASPTAEAPVAVNGPVGRTVLLLQPRAEEKGVELIFRACRDEIVVWATEEGLDRILVNLIGNAVKYTLPGGQVTVGLCQTGPEVFVTVADTGIGIPAEALPHLFEEFYRAPNAREARITGTGLGLAIVKQLVERYGGKMDIESTVGAGTTFTVIFPAYSSHR